MRSGMIGFLGAQAAAAAFDPAQLFGGSEVGGYWDVSVIGSLWQDTAGTIPVTADGDLVARIDDLSGNGYHATQATSGNRPVYRTSGGKAWLEGDGSRYLTCAGTQAAFAFAHKGAGTTILSAQSFYSVADPNAVCGACGNASGTSTQVGVGFWFDDRASVPANNRFSSMVSRGVSNSTPSTMQTDNVLPPNEQHVLALRHSSIYGIQQSIDAVQTAYAAAYSQGLSSANAAQNYQLMALGSNVLPLVGKWTGAILINRVITDTELGNCSSWFAALA